jgi:hypothetical protein
MVMTRDLYLSLLNEARQERIGAAVPDTSAVLIMAVARWLDDYKRNVLPSFRRDAVIIPCIFAGFAAANAAVCVAAYYVFSIVGVGREAVGVAIGIVCLFCGLGPLLIRPFTV